MELYSTTGRLIAYLEKILSQKQYYADYAENRITRAELREAMYNDTEFMGTDGINDEIIARIPRLRRDDTIAAEYIAGRLAAQKLIRETERGNMYVGFAEYRERIYAEYAHGKYITAVSPAEERVIYAISRIRRPKRVFAAGSYYGYLTAWAMENARENDGKAVLCDIDGEVCKLSEKNYERFGYKDNAEIYCCDAIKKLRDANYTIDMLIIDASIEPDDYKQNLRGYKRTEILIAAEQRLQKGSVIAIHDMDATNPAMKTLVAELRRINAAGASYYTFNGIGIYYVC